MTLLRYHLLERLQKYSSAGAEVHTYIMDHLCYRRPLYIYNWPASSAILKEMYCAYVYAMPAGKDTSLHD